MVGVRESVPMRAGERWEGADSGREEQMKIISRHKPNRNFPSGWSQILGLTSVQLNIPSNSLICKIINWVFILCDHIPQIFWFYISLACLFSPLILILFFWSLFYFIFCFLLLLSLLFLCVHYHWNDCYGYSPLPWPFALLVFYPAKPPLWIDTIVVDSGADWSKGGSPPT